LPAPFGPITARISAAPDSEVDAASAIKPPKRTVRPSVARMAAGASPRRHRPGRARRKKQRWSLTAYAVSFAGRRKHRLLAGRRRDDVMFAALDLEDELLREGLVILLAHHLSPSGIIACGHAQPFERVDQLRESSRPRKPDFSIPSLRQLIAS